MLEESPVKGKDITTSDALMKTPGTIEEVSMIQEDSPPESSKKQQHLSQSNPPPRSSQQPGVLPLQSPALSIYSPTKSQTDSITCLLSRLQDGFDIDEDEDIFELFDAEDKVARQELRRKRNELRRGAEYFTLTEEDVRQIIGLGLIPLLRRQCLLRHVLNGVPLPFAKHADEIRNRQQQKGAATTSSSSLRFSTPVKRGDNNNNNSMNVIAGGRTTSAANTSTSSSTSTGSSLPKSSPWDQAIYLANHLGHDIDKILN